MTKYVLCIGIDYKGTPFELKSCVRDAETMRLCFIHFFDIPEENIICLRETDEDVTKHPTKENILQWIKKITSQCCKNDEFILTYSGHGFYLKNERSEEKDKRDEVLCPLDCFDKGYIIDNTLLEYLKNTRENGVKISVITDACHSGTICDLPYVYDGMTTTEEQMSNNQNLKNLILSICSCKDSQQSFENRIVNRGVMTHSLIKLLENELKKARNYLKNENSYTKYYSIKDIHNMITKGVFKRMFPQDLMLSFSHPRDENTHILKLVYIEEKQKLNFSFIY